MKNTWILAENGSQNSVITAEPVTETGSKTTTSADANSPSGKPAQGQGSMHIIMLVVLFIFMYFVLFRGPQKKQKEHKKMVSSLKKNDRIRTIGGIIGTVVDIKEDEVTLKIDESNNTKIKIVFSAIGKNLSNNKS